MSGKIKTQEGGGGEAMHRLIDECIVRHLKLVETPGGTGLRAMDDGAVVRIEGCNVVFTTDSYVVQPVFFRGGDIGKLAVTGTINDLSVMGARPVALSLAIIVEEGFEKSDLEKIVRSAAEVCEALRVPVVTGDTKVVAGGGSGIMINTSGIGIADKVVPDAGLEPGDAVLLSGGVGEHGVAVLSQREGIAFDTELVSDCREVYSLVSDLMAGGIELHAAKDPTRGGIASALNEMASKSGVEVTIDEEAVPVADGVRSACEMLGLDPFEMANEGKVIVAVPGKDEKKALEIMKGRDPRAALIGRVGEKGEGKVVLETVIGSRRVLRMPLGDPVPRVC
jgi:hydrogenase expression/formation protein HypE